MFKYLNYYYYRNRNNIFYLAKKGYLSDVQRLVIDGADLERRNRHGRTPLLCAIRGGHFETAQYLIENYANPHARGNDGLTGLAYAAQNCSLKMIKYLIKEIGVNDFEFLHRALLEAAFRAERYLTMHYYAQNHFLIRRNGSGSLQYYFCYLEFYKIVRYLLKQNGQFQHLPEEDIPQRIKNIIHHALNANAEEQARQAKTLADQAEALATNTFLLTAQTMQATPLPKELADIVAGYAAEVPEEGILARFKRKLGF